MNVIYSSERHCDEHPNPNSLFLAGPTPRDASVESWRPEALKALERFKFSGIVYVPENYKRVYDYEEQIDWEWQALHASSVIIFWIPRDMEKLPGMTTNVEFGYWAAKDPNRVILGFPENAPKMAYLAALANRLEIPVFHEMESTIIAGMVLLHTMIRGD